MASTTSATGGILGANGTTNFMPGLASGLDTADMVEKLLSGTQSKIDKQNAKKQQIEWKQDIYRDVISKINTFHDKYFSFYGSGNTNLLSSGFYNVMSAASSSSAIKVTSATSSAAKNVTIDRITQLATSARATSADTMTGDLQGAVTGTYEADKTYAFDMTLDGVRKTIKFQGPDTANGETLEGNINASVKRVFGDTVRFDSSMKLQFNESSHRVVLSDAADKSDETVKTEGVLGGLGFKSGASNKLDYNLQINDVPFRTKLQGKNFTFSINGTEIEASADDTLGDIINRINNSEAGVRVSYSSLTDKFSIESTNSGAGIGITIEQSEGNLLSAMFGVEGAEAVTGVTKGLMYGKSSSVTGAFDDTAVDAYLASSDKKKKTLSFYMTDTSGREQKYSISISGKDYADKDALIQEINDQLKAKFGTAKSADETDTTEYQKVKLEIDGNGKPVLSSIKLNDDGKYDPAGTKEFQFRFVVDNTDESMNGMLGFSKVSEDTRLSDIGLGGVLEVTGTGAPSTIDLSALSTIGDLKDAFNAAGITAAFSDDGQLKLTGLTAGVSVKAAVSGDAAADAASASTMNALFGTTALEKAGSWTWDDTTSVTAGQNAKLTVGGTDIERNTNSFELDGITMELTAKSDTPISLTTSKDTDKIVEGIKGFVDDYNALIDELNKKLNADASYRDYAPLTDAQKKEMSEKEIEKWEEKAKEGLLRYDSNISKFLQDMRTVLYKTVESAGLAPYDIGIDTSSSYKDNGKLVLDEDKLKSALTTNLDDIQKMFTDKENGIAVQLQQVIKSAANPSSGSPGSLVRYAGTKDVMPTSNSLYYELKSVKESLTRLNSQYETERTRYWKQFTAMEQAISKMNSQSSWLTQQFS